MASSSPNLTEPSGEQVSAGGTVGVPGGYSDSFAQSNPGMLYLDITDSSGLLSADDASGHAVAGSGSNTIALSTTYANVNAILGSLQYAAGANSGADNIRVDVWNQAGTETIGSVPVTITAGGGTTDRWYGSVSSDWNNPANWSTGAVPTSGDIVQIYGNNANDPTLSNATLTGETIDLESSGNSSPLLTLNNVTLDSLLQTGNVGRVSIGGTLAVGAQGTLLASANANLQLSGTAETVVNNGLITAASNGVINIYNTQTNNPVAATLTNNGSIAANGGRIYLVTDSYLPGAPPHWNVQNSGSVTISNGGGLTVNGTLNGGQVTFNGTGALALQQPQPLTGGATTAGFGEGDQIDITGLASITAFNNGTLDLGTAYAIPLPGSFTLGNFEQLVYSYPPASSEIVYAPGGGASGQLSTDIVSPASGTVTQGGTLSLANVSIQTSGTDTSTHTLTITAASGTLYSPGQSGSGTSQITISGQTIQQLDADLQNTSYVPAGGASSDTVTFDLGNGGYLNLLRDLPVSIGAGTGGGGSGPALNEPSSETVAANGTVAVSGSYSDSFAAGNPGAMYLHIGDTSGTLSATNASGSLVAGSGSNSITLSTDYTDVNAVLHSLTYAAGASSGSDTISFDLWNQAGQETTGSVPVTIGGSTPPTTETWTGAVSSDWNNAANWSGGAVPTSGDTVLIADGTPNDASLSNAVLSGETITLQWTGGSLVPTVDFTNVTLDSVLEATGDGQVNLGGTLTIGAHGTIQTATGNDISLGGTAETIVNNGLIQSAGGGVHIYNDGSSASTATLINKGTIDANGGGLGLVSTAYLPGGPAQWDVLNSGSVTISNGGALTLNGTLDGGQVMFDGTGNLSLEQPQALTGGATVSGFGQGDSFSFYGPANGQLSGFNNGTLEVGTGGSIESIVLNGSYALGNFENEQVGGPGNPSIVAYAPSGGPSGLAAPDIVAPASDSVAQGGTLDLGNVSILMGGSTTSSANVTLGISAESGTLYMNGASGNGTSRLSLGVTSLTQTNADLSSLTYVPAAGSSSDTVAVSVTPGAPVSMLRYIPITIGGGSSGPALSEPASESVAANGTVAVSGSYSDSFAAGNPGKLWLGITDSSGTLSSTDASGTAVAGSGTNSIAVSTDYVDLNAILSNLHYTAGGSAGADTIHFDVWNQAGVETTGATSVTIGSMASAMAQASNAMMTNFAAPGSGSSSTLVPDNTVSVGSSSSMLNVAQQPTGIPLTLHG